MTSLSFVFLLLLSLWHQALGEVSVAGRRDRVSLNSGEEPCPGGTASAGMRESAQPENPHAVTHEHSWDEIVGDFSFLFYLTLNQLL